VITFSIQVKAPEGKRTTLLRCLRAMIGPTRVSPGCVGTRLYADLMEEDVLVLVEQWESREEFDRQLDPVKLRTLVAAIEFCSEAPVIHIDEGTRETGIDTLPLYRIQG
jgi:quinol monooxygenase YgiN